MLSKSILPFCSACRECFVVFGQEPDACFFGLRGAFFHGPDAAFAVSLRLVLSPF
jgi:hypothetical protein